jgi:acetyltransferase-like isoleucine patch superfamily enzyme
MKVRLRQIVRFCRSLFELLVIYLPGQQGILLRQKYYAPKFRRCGKDLRILPGVHLSGLNYIEIGDNVTIRENTIIQTGRLNDEAAKTDRRDIRKIGSYRERELGVVRIGDHARIAHGVLILGYGGVSIGEKCGIGPGSKIISESFHHKGRKPGFIYKYSQGAPPEETHVIQGFIEMKDGAGIASDVIVLPGATIGQDSWVGPRSVVKTLGNVPDFVIAAGDPAKEVFNRLSDTRSKDGAN